MFELPVSDPQLAAVIAVIELALGPDIEGVYLYGSSVAGGLRPGSDLDVFVVVHRAVTRDERAQLVERLSPISSRNQRPTSWRPVELTVVVASDVKPWRYPPRMDFQFGEWMRPGLDAGVLPQPTENADLVVLMCMIRLSSVPLKGPPAGELLDDVPWRVVVRAMTDGIAGLMADLESDTANVLLTLARIWATIETGEFVPKDAAADWAAERLPSDDRDALRQARDVYVGAAEDDWRHVAAASTATAERLSAEALRAASQL